MASGKLSTEKQGDYAENMSNYFEILLSNLQLKLPLIFYLPSNLQTYLALRH